MIVSRRRRSSRRGRRATPPRTSSPRRSSASGSGTRPTGPPGDGLARALGALGVGEGAFGALHVRGEQVGVRPRVVALDVLDEVRRHGGRFDDADLDVERRGDRRQRLHEALDGELGSAVGVGERLTDGAADRRHRQDRAGRGLAHVRQCGLRQCDGREVVRLHLLLDRQHVERLRRTDAPAPRVVDEHVESPVLLDDRIDELLARAMIGDVEFTDVERDARLGRRLVELARLVERTNRRDDRGARLGESDGGMQPHAAGGSGDERDLRHDAIVCPPPEHERIGRVGAAGCADSTLPLVFAGALRASLGSAARAWPSDGMKAVHVPGWTRGPARGVRAVRVPGPASRKLLRR